MSLAFLARTGPSSTYDAVSESSAAVVIAAYSSSFGLASRLLAEPVRTRIRNVYALVRVADEIVDDPDPTVPVAARGAMLACLEDDTRQALVTGRSANLVVHAYARTARTCGITWDLVEPFFASMRADLTVARHDQVSFERYVYGSAEVVGLMCLRVFLADAWVLGRREATYQALAPGARRLGAAFQKLNFLRDLGQDYDDLGRSYFPGLEADRITEVDKDAILDDIEADLAAAAPAIDHLPTGSRRAVRAAHLTFAELAARLRHSPVGDLRRRRIRVPGRVKLRILATLWWAEKS